jgi:hypothetical protein
MKKVLIDTGVWISYFDDRRAKNYPELQLKYKERHLKAQKVIKYLTDNKFTLCYMHYIEKELTKHPTHNRKVALRKIKKIATEIEAYFGNDCWEKIDIPWEKLGSPWDNDEEARINDILDKQLPDKSRKSNREDRKIALAFLQEPGVIALLHENPKDFKKINLQEISVKTDLNKKIIDIYSLNFEEIENILSKFVMD